MLCYGLQDTELFSKSLLSFHAFTGCDTAGASSGKGKLKLLKVMLKKPRYLSEFADIGSDPDISNEQLEILQTFICDLYGLKDDRVNLLIY